MAAARVRNKAVVKLKTTSEIVRLYWANQIVAAIHERLAEAVAPGVTTGELDAFAEELIRAAGATPAFKGYGGPPPFPAVTCISVNEEIVHGIPGRRRLRDGDIVSIDVGVRFEGMYGDAAVTLPVGQVSDVAERLIEVSWQALDRAIDKARPGGRLSDISHAVQSHVEAAGFSVVTAFTGHGVGKNLHEEPKILNYGPPGRGLKLKPGLVLAIEPMVNVGTPDVRMLSDHWTAVTADGKLSAHVEHSVAILQDGPFVLSRLREDETELAQRLGLESTRIVHV